MGSTNVVTRLKRLLHPNKIGHAGTLDPMATGVLPIAVGHATKLIPFVMDGTKIYEFRVVWGSQTDTDDAEGTVIAQSNRRPTEAEIRAVIPDFIGEIAQMPPAYSALKIGGKRAYDLAREGKDVPLVARPVQIMALEPIQMAADYADFRVTCGKGTYVRSIARDMGVRLGCLGHVAVLRRVACGPFALDMAQKLEGLTAETVTVIPMVAAMGSLPVMACSPTEWNRLRQGQRLSVRQLGKRVPETEGTVVCLMIEGQIGGLARIQAGAVHPYRIFM